jgi:hypothetical protein
MKRACFFLMLCAAAMAAADVSGTWQLSYVREDGRTHVSTLTLNADGTGTISSPLGTAPISNVKVSGNDISFVSVRRAQYDEIVVSYTGKIEGESLKLQMQYSGRRAVAITGKRTGTP